MTILYTLPSNFEDDLSENGKVELREECSGRPDPSGRKPRRYERLAVLLVAAAGFSFVVALNLTPVSTSDFWIELKVGDVIRDSGQIPKTLEYSFTEAKDNVFIAFEWLPSLLWSYLYVIDGYNGMIVVKCFFSLCIFALIVLLAVQIGRGPVLALALGCLTMLGINFRSLLRPEIIAFVLVLANLNLLYAFVRRGNPLWLVGLIPSSVIWANSHGSFLVNLTLPIFFAAGEIVDGLWEWKRTGEKPDLLSLRRRVGWLALAWLGTIGASLINPYGVHLLSHVAQISGKDFIRANIWEWQSPFHPRFHGEPFQIIFWGITALIAVATAMGRNRVRATPLFLVLVFFGLALSTMRHIAWFEIMGAYFLAHTLPVTLDSQRWKITGAIVVALVLFAGTTAVATRGNTLGRRPGFWNDAPMNPEVIQFIRDTGISGNVLHHYNYGDQLAYHFYPTIRVVMDTRADAYGEKHYMQFRRLSGGNPALQGEPSELVDFVEKYDVRAIVTEHLNIYVWFNLGHAEALKKLGFVGAYRDRKTVILTRE
jgi:hypothetical protein